MLEKWNPTIKAASILISVLLLSFQYKIILNIAVFIIALTLLLFCSKTTPSNVLKLLIPAFIAAFGLFMTGLYYAKGSSISAEAIDQVSTAPYILQAALANNIHTALQLSTRLLAFASLGMLFALTTKSDYFIASLLHQLKLSPKFAYGILAAFHLMPGMIREFKQVRIAYKVRGIPTTPWSMKPVFTMLVNAVRWSESIAMAMESKGFSGESKRTYYSVPKVHVGDILGAIIMIGLIGAGIFI